MAKLNDLNLSDDTGPGKADELTHSERVADRFVQRLKAMRLDATFDYAADTIDGIMETVEATKRVTDAQQQAINNIEEGGLMYDEQRDRGGRRGGSRRYEGWSGRHR